jgi:HAT1-interacting factor 1
MSVQSAKAYYEYGNALLMNEEENPSDDLIGPSKTAGGANEENNQEEGGNEEEEENGEEEEGDGEGGDEGEGENEENKPAEETDLEVAWEVLDVARVILEKENDPKNNSLLANVRFSLVCVPFFVLSVFSQIYLRLGDLLRLNCKFQDAIREYSRSLEIQSSICAPSDRILSNIYFNLAVAYIYQSSEKDTANPIHDKEFALQNYIAARDVLVAGAKEQSSSSSSSSSSMTTVSNATDSSSSSSSTTEEEKKTNDIEELIDELNETIEALKAEIKEVRYLSLTSPHSIFQFFLYNRQRKRRLHLQVPHLQFNQPLL